MKKYNLSEIMHKAWKLYRKGVGSFAEALHRAWNSAKAAPVNAQRIEKAQQTAGVAEQVKFKEAQTALFLTDNETTEQVAASTGSARATDLGVGGFVLGKIGGGAGMGWSNTNEGKVIAAAFLHSHNQLVHQLRLLQEKELPPPVATKPQAGSANQAKR